MEVEYVEDVEDVEDVEAEETMEVEEDEQLNNRDVYPDEPGRALGDRRT